MYTHDRGVRYSLPSGTDDIDGKTTQSSNGRRWAKFQHVVLLGSFYSATVPTDSIYGKKIVKVQS